MVGPYHMVDPSDWTYDGLYDFGAGHLRAIQCAASLASTPSHGTLFNLDWPI